METIDWSPSFSVGVERLDEQHRRIIGMINRLVTDPGAAAGPAAISELLIRLTSYANDHFRLEEDLLEKQGYPAVDDQKKAHAAFRRQVVGLFRKTAEERFDPEAMFRYLHDWWVDHILGSDMKYRSFLEERGVR